MPKARFDRLVPIVLVLPSGCAIEFASIPAGEFLMGEPGMRTDTGPVRTVRITRPFQLSKYEVTQEVWQAVMGSNPSWFKSPVRPVESVSTEQIDLFFEKLNQLDSKYEYSLPTEAEWEYVVKTGLVPQADLAGTAWYREDSKGETHPVGMRHANAFGVFDMGGNVWEVVADCYSSSYYSTRPRFDVNPRNSHCPNPRPVLRGGSYSTPDSFCAPTFRFPWNKKYPPANSVGFRILRRLKEE